ncbi:hypothetical protein LCGC14_2888410 [marine sediment metagenome]|uniref:Uncharacterized protein n=1 Tax=marine sediment metagenome TaxID=412755 RepID=A0A0F9AP51_9ZZZZ
MEIVTAQIIEVIIWNAQVHGLVVSTDGKNRLPVWVKGRIISYMNEEDYIDIFVEWGPGQTMLALDIVPLGKSFYKSTIWEAIGTEPHPYMVALIKEALND